MNNIISLVQEIDEIKKKYDILLVEDIGRTLQELAKNKGILKKSDIELFFKGLLFLMRNKIEEEKV